MRKEFQSSLVIVICAILGVVTAAIVGLLNTQGVISYLFTSSELTIGDFQFLIFFIWLVVGIIVGVFKD